MIRGAGGLSIAPHLHIQSVWALHGERYNELMNITRDSRQDGLLIPTLLRAFSEQRLSPYDTFSSSRGGAESLMDVCSQTSLTTQNMVLIEDRFGSESESGVLIFRWC